MNERMLTASVLAYAGHAGLLAHHCPDSRRCQGTPGLPDLIILGPKGVLFAELKGPDGDTSADQDRWLYWFHQRGIPYAVWWPGDWQDGTIQAALEKLA